jgi:hypothetical protein
MKAKTKDEAFLVANSIMVGDYEYDTILSKRCGYPIYKGIYRNEWISDLGVRLEVNTEDGKSINIWIHQPTLKKLFTW